MRKLFVPYLVVYLSLSVTASVGNIDEGEVVVPAADLMTAAIATVGMFLYRTRREYSRLRQTWKWIIPLLLPGMVFGSLSYSLKAFSSEGGLALDLLDVSLTVLLLTPAFWMNARYASGYSQGRRRIRAITRPAEYASRPSMPTPTDRRIDWVLIVAIFGAIGTAAGVIIGIQSYKLTAARPQLALHLYKAIGNTEYWYDQLHMSPTAWMPRGGLSECDVPLKVINHSDYDAADVTIWVRSTTAGAVLVSADPRDRVQRMAGEDWLVMSTSPLSPQSAIKCNGIRLRSRKTVRRVDVSWQIYASRMPPQHGTLKLYF